MDHPANSQLQPGDAVYFEAPALPPAATPDTAALEHFFTEGSDARAEYEQDRDIARICSPGIELPPVVAVPLVDMPGVGAIPESMIGISDAVAMRDRLLERNQPDFTINLTADDVLEMKAFDREERQRNRLLSQLLFASRELAEYDILRHAPTPLDSEGGGRWCRRCHMNEIGGRIAHTESCATGRVLSILEALQSMAAVSGGKEAACVDSKPALSPEQPSAESASSPRKGLGEPWTADRLDARTFGIRDKDNRAVGILDVGVNGEAVMHRIIDCVNSCAPKAAQDKGRRFEIDHGPGDTWAVTLFEDGKEAGAGQFPQDEYSDALEFGQDWCNVAPTEGGAE